MTAEEAVPRVQVVLAHLWMVRTFLKHAEEIQDDAELLEVHRTIFDSVRAVEPSYQAHDWAKYLRRIRGKLPKLRRVAELFAREYRRITDHTNYEMASVSLAGAVSQLEVILASIGPPPPGTAEAADDAAE